MLPLLLAPLLLGLVVLRWLHLRFVRPLGWAIDAGLLQWEESIKSLLREWTHEGVRLLNAWAALVLSIFSRRSYHWTSRGGDAGAVGDAWRDWWQGSTGTFNALLEREGLSRADSENGEASAAAEASAASAPRPASARRRRGPMGWLPKKKAPPAPAAGRGARPVLLPRGSKLFGLPSGFAVAESLAGRRGLVEGLRFKLEVATTRAFDAARRVVRRLLLIHDPPGAEPATPRAERGAARGSSSSSSSGRGPRPEQSDGRWEDLQTWTASEAILAAGYPLEECSVQTCDGYILTMHRIPHRASRRVVFFQHGVFDSSLGWVANGSVGSQAFAAWDAGFDVFLANSRSNPPRRTTDKRRGGARYWSYSVNELAANDIAAQVNHLHALKLAELPAAASSQPAREAPEAATLRRVASDSALRSMRRIDLRSGGGGGVGSSPRRRREGSDDEGWGLDLDEAPATLARSQSAGELGAQGGSGSGAGASSAGAAAGPSSAAEGQAGQAAGRRLPRVSSSAALGGEVLPYRLQAVGHSLGAACLLMYVVLCRMRGQPQRVRRLILMSPAGFHAHLPMAMQPFKYALPALARVLGLLRPGTGIGLRLPSPLLRHITFRLALDMRLVPALQDLVSAALRFLTSGDQSQWLAAARLPHYSAASMPALSLHCGAHFGQWARDASFRLFDYGSRAANRRHYGTDRPPSIADHYHLLSDLAVDIVAGSGDGVIRAADVRTHYDRLAAAGVPATFRVFGCAHLDLTFAVLDEVRHYVLQQLEKPGL